MADFHKNKEHSALGEKERRAFQLPAINNGNMVDARTYRGGSGSGAIYFHSWQTCGFSKNYFLHCKV
jgi:hypothetical protein